MTLSLYVRVSMTSPLNSKGGGWWGVAHSCLGLCVLTDTLPCGGQSVALPWVVRFVFSNRGVALCFLETGSCVMRRRPVSKGRSARKFRKQVTRTKRANVARPPARGGHRL